MRMKYLDKEISMRKGQRSNLNYDELSINIICTVSTVYNIQIMHSNDENNDRLSNKSINDKI